jgi:hypothetical protein
LPFRLSCCSRKDLLGKDDKMANSLFTDFFDALAGGPMLLGDDGGVEEDEDDAFLDDEDLLESSDDDDDLLLGNGPPPGLAAAAGGMWELDQDAGADQDVANPCAIM